MNGTKIPVVPALLGQSELKTVFNLKVDFFNDFSINNVNEYNQVKHCLNVKIKNERSKIRFYLVETISRSFIFYF